MKKFLCALGLLAAAPGASATVINFDAYELPGAGYTEFRNGYSEKGFTLSRANVLLIPQQDQAFYKGSASMLVSYWDDTVMLGSDTGLFSLKSIDLARFANWGDMDVTFTGWKANGETVRQTFAAYGSAFTTHQFSAEFSQLDAVTWTQGPTGYAMHFDNIVVERHGIPEPASAALLGLGLAAFAALRHRKAKA